MVACVQDVMGGDNFIVQFEVMQRRDICFCSLSYACFE